MEVEIDPKGTFEVSSKREDRKYIVKDKEVETHLDST